MYSEGITTENASTSRASVTNVSYYGDPIGQVRKFKNTRTETYPWQAFMAKGAPRCVYGGPDPGNFEVGTKAEAIAAIVHELNREWRESF